MNNAETSYNERISHVEQHIIFRLKEKLANAKSSADMFRAFSKFNSLFIRPKIRGAIHEYQTKLIDRVKEDVKKLQEKFMSKYSNSEALQITKIRDIPPVAGAIIWAKSIEKQCKFILKK